MFDGDVLGKKRSFRTSRSNRRKSNAARRPRRGLFVDTTVCRHRGEPPRQVFPKSSKLIFIGPNDVKTTKSNDQRIKSNEPLARAGSHDLSHSRSIPHSDLLQRRLKSHGPSPLDLSKEISPSDRAITIGLSVPSARAARYADVLGLSQQPREQLTRANATTPTIIITPARDYFTPESATITTEHEDGCRPASSVYSRNTRCISRQDFGGQPSVPPIPPLPPFVPLKFRNKLFASTSREANLVSEEVDREQVCRQDRKITVPSLSQHIEPGPLTSQSHLPTPRRSKGWWNVLLSPFSAGKTSPAWWRSPPTEYRPGSDGLPLLEGEHSPDQPALHKGLILFDRTSHDVDGDELRSAPVQSSISSPVTVLRRSNTASGALDPNSTAVNIYHIPTCGEAAAYYDPSRHFPSICLDDVARDVPIGWSPSHSVARPRTHPLGSGSASEADLDSTPSTLGHHPSIEGTDNDCISPLGNVHKIDDTRRQPTIERGILSSPTAEELMSQGESREQSSYIPSRQSVHGVVQSHFSPMTTTTFLDSPPQTHPFSADDYENLRLHEVTRPSMGQYVPPSSQPSQDTVFQEKLVQTQSLNRPEFTRNDSRGLGIVHADTNDSFFPPPRIATDKLELETDKFGQLQTRSSKPARRPWHKRFIWLFTAAGVICLVLLIVLLVLFLTGRHKDAPVEAHWLNLTGFPALPVGVTTVVQPRLASSQSGCVNPQSLWSCSTPQQPPINSRSAQTTTPNFRFEIRFRNDSFPANVYVPAINSTAHTARARAVARRGSWLDTSFTPLPPPPGATDQLFVGKTTDNTSAPYDGIETPFFISLVDPVQLGAGSNSTSSLSKRDTSSTSSFNPYPYPTPVTSSAVITSADLQAPTSIPQASVQSDGEPQQQVLYPRVNAQPLRLYNRNTSNEHYGFYTYFDRTLLVSISTNDPRLLPGSNLSAAATTTPAICTWSQTRFHVQIWTRRPAVEPLITTPPGSSDPAAANSTANDFNPPGSFPLRVTITLDRHGGEADEKGVYCYALNANDQVIDVAKSWVPEDRAWDGVLVNPAQVPGVNSTTTAKATNSHKQRRQTSSAGVTQGGIDGGTGGCACEWQNWDG